MKRISFLMAFLMVASLTIMTSCSEDVGTIAPTVTVTSDVTMARPGSKVTLTIKATDDENDMTKVVVTPSVGTAQEFTVDAEAEGEQSFTYEYTVPETYDANITFDVVAFDEGPKDGTPLEGKGTATVSTGEAITTQASLKMGDNTHMTLGSYYVSLGSGQVMLSAAAAAEPTKVDLVYSVDGLAAPSAARAASVTGLTTKNATSLAKVSGVTFADLANDGMIVAKATGMSAQQIQPAQGDVFVFETASTSANAGKKGILVIDNKTGNEMTISVKIQSAAAATK